MGEAFFYHMTRTPLEATLPVLLAKSLDAGWRVAVRARDEARLAWLDQRLWLGATRASCRTGLRAGRTTPTSRSC